ncbi:Olfactory receptor 5 [Cricetulus griseus]|uniref:Olfactory receptor 5 n=1 Tax=Cricetulus griseus TaxID=10029 RepID=G3IIL1_CRIGR|nr:Olfactory receptor 5 [Cricetulus griseus]
MYFFLGNLSGLEMCYVSVTMPSLLMGLRSSPCHVSFTSCMAQLFLFISFIGTKCTLLASMAYDRYVAICRPLHYPLLMRPQLVDFISAIVVFCGSLLVALASYVAIGRVLIRMPSAAASRRALSTCASHLLVMGVFYSVVLFMYSRPRRIKSADLHKVLSVIYTVATPMCSPIIYGLRNREVHAVLKKTLHVC